MKKKTKIKILKGSLCVLTGFFLVFMAYYERKIDRNILAVVDTAEDNNRVYKDLSKENFMDTLENETGVVLLVNSRVNASKFIDLLYDLKGDYTIYVYSLKNDEISLALNDEGEVVVNQKQTKLYDELIEYLGVYADDYILVMEDGSFVNTKYKKVYTPTVLFIKEGKPIYSYAFIEEGITDEDLSEIYKDGYEILSNGYNS